MPRLKLTAKAIDKLESNGTAQAEFWDTYMPGLCLRVGRSGLKVWTVRYRANGSQRRHKLGVYPRLSLADARQAARDALARADAGGDPAMEKQERRADGSTFGALAEEVLDARARKGRDGRPTRERTQRERRRILERELLPAWGKRNAASINRREVVRLVERIARRAPVQANRTLAVIRLIFNDGIRRGFPGLESNPAHLVEPPGNEEGRDRFLDPDEIKKVWEATEPESPSVRGIIRLALLTGQRVGSVQAMKWSDVTDDLWTIPAADFKGKRTHLVPLSRQAVAVLDSLRDPAPHDETFVFPSRARTKTGHLTNMGKPLERVRERSELAHWTLHDLRTTWRTHATRAKEEGGLGIAPNVADAVLGHIETSLGFSRYTGDRERYLLAEKRQALRAWGGFIAKAVAS